MTRLGTKKKRAAPKAKSSGFVGLVYRDPCNGKVHRAAALHAQSFREAFTGSAPDAFASDRLRRFIALGLFRDAAKAEMIVRLMERARRKSIDAACALDDVA